MESTTPSEGPSSVFTDQSVVALDTSNGRHVT
jgi:hypothetical protein